MSNDALLKEIRERYDYLIQCWREIREEARRDMKFVSGDPWDPKERRARESVGRACLSLDELSQYLNQATNNVRIAKRSIKVTPEGNGSNDDTAELTANLIRGIEYKSKAQSAYSYAFQCSLERSYGYVRVGKRYESEHSFNQEVTIRRIPNPDSVLIDWDCKEADCSDMRYAFIIDTMTRKVFLNKWPDATVRDFSGDIIEAAPGWIEDDRVNVAEYWKVETKKRKLVKLSTGEDVFLDAIPGKPKLVKDATAQALQWPNGNLEEILAVREVDDPSVIQYVTNGVEILETNPWDGKYIPIGVMFGKEMYVDDGVGTKRQLVSLVRLARDPVMLYNYVRTSQFELVGQTPRTPYIGYEGQFEGHEGEWEMVNRVPIPYLQARALTDATGGQVLPLPQRQTYEPAIQALEMLSESTKRAIQNALGMHSSNSVKADVAGKSGKAMQEQVRQSDASNFHFVDNFDRMLTHIGRIVEDLIPSVYDSIRDVGVVRDDETQASVHLNEPSMDKATGQLANHQIGDGDHGITISTGPAYDSERERASEFVDNMVQNIQNLPIPPAQMAQIISILVKMKNLGPLGDKLAQIIDPTQSDDAAQQLPKAMQALQHNQQQLQMLDAYSKQLEAKLSEVQRTLDSKMMDNQTKERIAALQAETQLMIANTKLVSVETIEGLKADLARNEMHIRTMIEGMKMDHAADTQAADQAHQIGMADMQAQQAQEQPTNA